MQSHARQLDQRRRSRLMLIGQLVDACGIPATTLRFYEAQGILDSERDCHGYREYDASSLQQLARVRILRSAGYSLAEIRTFDDVVNAGAPTHVISQHIQRLDDHLVVLQSARAEIESILLELHSESPASSACHDLDFNLD